MFPNPKELEDKIGLVITKGDPELSGTDYIDQLELDKNDGKNNVDVKNWFNFFKLNNDHVFVFPKASRSKIGEDYNFYDHAKILHFLQKSQISNISHNIALSENAALYMINMKNNLIQDVNSNCRNIFYIINGDINNANSSSEFNYWITKMKQLNSLFICNIENLICFFNQNIPKSYRFNPYFENLKKIRYFKLFHQQGNIWLF